MEERRFQEGCQGRTQGGSEAMKRSRSRYTLRGNVQGTQQLVVDDGLFTNGFRVVWFEMWQINRSAGAEVVLHTTSTPPTRPDCAQGSQIAWSFYTPADTDRGLSSRVVVDPDHIINEDMYITALDGVLCSYIILLEPYQMTEDEAVLQLIKNNNQV